MTAPKASLPRLIVTSGEPAGIGPDLCLKLAAHDWPCELVIAGDPALLAERARQLNLSLDFVSHQPAQSPAAHRAGTVRLAAQRLAAPCVPGRLDPANARYVLALIDAAVAACQRGEFDAMVTAPVQKSVINDAGIPFTGHTEYLAAQDGGEIAGHDAGRGVTAGGARHDASAAQASQRSAARRGTGRSDDRAGSRPARALRLRRAAHRGLRAESARRRRRTSGPRGNRRDRAGHCDRQRDEGIAASGPLPADTAFTPHMLADADAVLAMYHDQGLPVLKYAGFGRAVNVTLGLPIIRTSVDHGTALELAGTGNADAGSLIAAVEHAIALARNRASVSADERARASASASTSSTIRRCSRASSRRSIRNRRTPDRDRSWPWRADGVARHASASSTRSKSIVTWRVRSRREFGSRAYGCTCATR